VIFALALSLVIPALAGYFLLDAFGRDADRLPPGLLLRVCLGAGLGLGLCSCVYFFLLPVTAAADRPWIADSLFLAAAVLAAACSRRREAGRASAGAQDAVPSEAGIPSFLLGSLVAVLALAAATFVLLSLARPHGGWDAVAIWNMKARHLFRGDGYWRNAFSPLLPHPDYPLLVPLSIVRMWKYSGSETQAAPALLSMFFTFATVLTAYAAVAVRRGGGQGCLAAMVVLSTRFLREGASQYADVPLGFYFLAAAVLLLHGSRSGGKRAAFAAAGTAAALSAWTKNEGWLFLVSATFAASIVPALSGRLQEAGERVLRIAAGAVPALLAVVYLKAVISPPGYLFDSGGFQVMAERSLDLPRYWGIAKTFLWESTKLPIPALLVYGLCLGGRVDAEDRGGVASLVVLLALMIFGFALVYAVTPLDMAWQLRNSANRLLVQVWPAFVFMVFLIVRPLDRVAMSPGAAP
jgi:hypothetical protein